MAVFTYTAIDGKGKQVKGSLEVESQMKASEQLKKDGLTIIELKEGSALNKEVSLGSFGKKKVKIRDLSLLCRQFVSLNRAGVTIVETLKMLAEQTENPTLQEALVEVSTSVQKGDMAATIAQQPKLIGKTAVNLTHRFLSGEKVESFAPVELKLIARKNK